MRQLVVDAEDHGRPLAIRQRGDGAPHGCRLLAANRAVGRRLNAIVREAKIVHALGRGGTARYSIEGDIHRDPVEPGAERGLSFEATESAPGAQPGMPFPMPAAMFAALDPAEIDRKIAELRIIENWLTMSVSMMQMSIKTMELQKASLEAMRGGGAAR